MFLDAEEKVYDRPFMLIENGVLKKYIADEDGIVTIPECVETIASGVFSWDGMPEDQFDYWESENEQMLDRIHIPATVKAIEPGAFLGTFYLQDFSIDPNCPAAELIDGILYSRDKKRVIFATKGMRDIPEIKLPSTVKVIDDYAFMGRFFDKLVLPDSVERIGVGAFAYGGFDSVTIPDSVKEIGEDALWVVDLTTIAFRSEKIAPSLKRMNLGFMQKMVNCSWRSSIPQKSVLMFPLV